MRGFERKALLPSLRARDFNSPNVNRSTEFPAMEQIPDVVETTDIANQLRATTLDPPK
jgi:hypothetical protein